MPPHFVYAPPDFETDFYAYRSPVPPYPDAPRWQQSVYYYWWLYLRRNADYRETCLSDGKGPCADLYRDFGNIYEVEFSSWWENHWHLFAERDAIVDATVSDLQFDRSLTLRLDLTAKRSRLLEELRHLITNVQSETDQARVASTAKYPVATNPILSSMHQHLVVWDMKQMNPSVADPVLADISDIRVNHVVDGLTAEQARLTGRDATYIISEVKRRKTQAAQRHIRIADQYIENAGKGIFPQRIGR